MSDPPPEDEPGVAACCGRHSLDAGNASMSACDIPSRSGANIGPTLSLFLLGVAGNLLALLVLLRRRRLVKSTRTSLFYSLLTVLIAADLMAQLLTSSAPLAVYARGSFNATTKQLRLTWNGGSVACQAHAVVMTTVSLGEPLLVLCMSVERLLCLANKRRRRRISRWLVALLAAALLVACLPLAGLGSYRLQYPATWCFVDSHSSRLADRIFAAGLALWNLAVILLIVACNLWVIIRLLSVWRVRKAMLAGTRPSGTAAAMPTDAKLSGGGGARPRYMRAMEVQLVVILIAITASFALCWSPLMIRLVLNSIASASDCARDLSAVHLASINQILDPWLYILLRKSNFQRLWRLLSGLRCGARTSSIMLAGCHGNDWRQRRRPPSALLLRRCCGHRLLLLDGDQPLPIRPLQQQQRQRVRSHSAPEFRSSPRCTGANNHWSAEICGKAIL